MQRSRTGHYKAESDVLACSSFEKRDMVGSHYGSLANRDPGKELLVTKKYGKEYVEVNAELFWRWELELSKAINDNKGQTHLV